MTILNTKIMQLDNALSSSKDTKGQIVSFKVDPKNSDVSVHSKFFNDRQSRRIFLPGPAADRV